MADLLSRATSDHRWQLVGTAILSGGLVAASLLGWQRLAQEERVYALKHSLPDPRQDDPELQKLTRIGTMTPASTSTPPLPPSPPSEPLVPIPPPTTAMTSSMPSFNATKEDIQNYELAQRAQAGDFDPTLIHEQLARNRTFLTPAGLEKLRDAFVIIIGCGGVGSHATAALARSGVSRIRLVDFDQVTLSSLNRHAVATLADVGTAKVACLQRRLEGVVPWVKFDGRIEKFDADSAEGLLRGWKDDGPSNSKPDFVIDAIDNIDTKVALLEYCHHSNIRVVSAMGAGCKSDPTRIVVGDISSTTDDALSKSVRRRLKLRGITHGIATVFSTERADANKAQLLPLSEEEFKKGSVKDLGVLPDFRVRILPVLGTMPAVFGYTVANHVILQITGYPTDYVPGKGTPKLYESVQMALQASEEKLIRSEPGADRDSGLNIRIPITPGEISFLVEDIYRGRSAISGIPTRLVLVRWQKPAPEGESILIKTGEGKSLQKTTRLRLRDLVCVTREEAVAHEKGLSEGKGVEEMYGVEVIRRVERRREEIARWEDEVY